MSFVARLHRAIAGVGGPCMVGLDPRPDHFPEEFRPARGANIEDTADAVRRYHRQLLPLIAPKAAAIKPQVAFFERLGPAGLAALADAMEHAHELGLLVVADAKRGDIGSTAEAYAETWLAGAAFPAADALTVNPYLGEDACEPFLRAAQRHDAGLFVLVKTSNPGAGLFQDHGQPTLAEIVADKIAAWGDDWHDEDGWSSVGAVVGATRPEELAAFRARMPRAPLLLPGYGFQGGEGRGLQAAFDDHGCGAIVNSSRAILFAHEREDLAHLPSWQDKVKAALDEMKGDLSPLVSGGIRG